MQVSRVLGQMALAASFITRLPIPFAWCKGEMGEASRFFSWVGLFIGLICWVVLALMTPLVGAQLAAVLAVIAVIALTGAFHQDGLADLCDGFWGAWERERKLAIMKDSMIGTYGVLALCSMFALSVIALAKLPLEYALALLVTVHSGSRAIAGVLPALLPYARVAGNSKTPQSSSKPGINHLLVLWAAPIIPLCFLPANLVFALLLSWSLALWGMKRLMQRHIQGYTGDTLGATQQVVEMISLLVAVAMLGSH